MVRNEMVPLPLPKPCRFCGSAGPEFIRLLVSGIERWCYCRECGSSGPIEETDTAAINGWNLAWIDRRAVR